MNGTYILNLTLVRGGRHGSLTSAEDLKIAGMDTQCSVGRTMGLQEEWGMWKRGG